MEAITCACSCNIKINAHKKYKFDGANEILPDTRFHMWKCSEYNLNATLKYTLKSHGPDPLESPLLSI